MEKIISAGWMGGHSIQIFALIKSTLSVSDACIINARSKLQSKISD
jgi:hypothetical protein